MDGVCRDARAPVVGTGPFTRLLWLTAAAIVAISLIAVAPSLWVEAAPEAAPATPDDGAKLADVRVEGNTTIPTASIARHIRTRPDRPYAAKQVRDDVKALYATRWFFSVEPRFRSTEAGLVLIFRVQERPIVQRVEYRGNKKIKTKHLAARTGLKKGSPFDVSANREAARRLEAYYHESGHAFATVKLAKGGEKTDRDVIFEIREGPVVRVGSVKFRGNKFFSGPVLGTKLRTKKTILWAFGGQYDPATIPDDVAALKQYYHSLGFFDVNIKQHVGFNKSKSRAHITYDIVEGTRYKVRNVQIVGNRIFNEKQLRDQLELVEGQFFNARTLQEDVQKIKDDYGALGRIFARIDAAPRFLERDGVADLVYRIDEDRVYHIRRVDVVLRGDHPHTRRSVVRNRMLIHPGELADPKKIRQSRIRLGGVQIFEGRMNPAEAPEIRISRVQPDGTIRQAEAIRGQNGRGSRVESREPERRAKSEERGLRPLVPTKEKGQRTKDKRTKSLIQSSYTPRRKRDPFDISNLNLDGSRKRGDERVYVEREADLPFRDEPLPAFHVRKQHDGYLPDEPSPVVTREQASGDDALAPISVYRGQNPGPGPLRTPPDPRFFGSPQGDPLRGEFREIQPGLLDLEVRATEARTGRFMFGVGVNSDAGVIGSIVLSEQNFDILRPPRSFQDVMDGTAFRGGGQKFRAEAFPGNVVSRYLVSWTDPYFMNTDYSLSVSGFYYTRFFDDWDERRGGGRVALGRQLTQHWSVGGFVRLEEVRITDPDVPTPPALASVVGSSFLSTGGATLTHDTRDTPYLPGEGHFVEFEYEQAFGDFVYPRFRVNGKQFFTMYKRPDGQGRHILTLSGQVGWTGSDTPLFENFFAGGFQTFRGFDFRGVGPRVLGVRVGDRWMFLGSTEYLFPLMANEMLQGVVFSDYGTVENPGGFDDFRVTAGFGLRVTVPQLGSAPLAFDFAWPIMKETFDDTRVFSFYVGFTR